MEPGQGQPQGAYTIEEDDCRRIYRDVIIQALRDLGSNNSIDRSAVIRWIPSEAFDHCCILADWEDSWLRDVFKSVASLNDSVRKQVSTQCVNALKFLKKMNEESGYFITSHLEHVGKSSDESSGEYNFNLNESKVMERVSKDHLPRYSNKYKKNK